MIELYSPITETFLRNLPTSATLILRRPMSKDARHLVDSMFEWACQFSRFTASVVLNIIISRWDPLIFERAVHTYKDFSSKLTKIALPKKAVVGNLVDFFYLSKLNDKEWVSNNLTLSGNQVGSINNYETRLVYEWLITNYLISDFTYHDLNKIIEMSRLGLDKIKIEALNIKDNDKRTIAYLYAIMTNVAQRDQFTKIKNIDVEEKNDKKILALYEQEELAKANKTGFTLDPNRHKRWEEHQEWYDILKSLDTD